MSYQSTLVRLGYTVVDTSEVSAIEPHGKKRKRTVVHLKGGQSMVVALRVKMVCEVLWGVERGGLEHGSVCDAPELMVPTNARLNATFDELAHADAVDESWPVSEHADRSLALWRMIDKLVEEGAMPRSLWPMFPRRAEVHDAIEEAHPSFSYELKKIVDERWFAETLLVREKDPESSQAVMEARIIIDGYLKPAQIAWAREKVKRALEALDKYWGRDAYDWSERFEAFLERHPEPNEENDDGER